MQPKLYLANERVFLYYVTLATLLMFLSFTLLGGGSPLNFSSGVRNGCDKARNVSVCYAGKSCGIALATASVLCLIYGKYRSRQRAYLMTFAGGPVRIDDLRGASGLGFGLITLLTATYIVLTITLLS